MAERFVIVRFDVTQGDASGHEIATFANPDEARRTFDEGRASGAYADGGNSWSGGTAFELLRRSDAGYTRLDDGTEAGPTGLLGAPTITSSEIGGTWSLDPGRRVGWPS
ncbi:MAG: hypothetical protein ABI193_24975 [Minicystis sp.]